MLFSLLASGGAADLFPAVEINGRALRDGIFSYNPPIRTFVFGTGETPGGIWIVRINPVERAEVPVAMEEIIDRRSDLTANRSLEQESYTIRSRLVES